MAHMHMPISDENIKSRANRIVNEIISRRKTTKSWSIFRAPHKVGPFGPENFPIGLLAVSQIYDSMYDIKKRFLVGLFGSKVDEDIESKSYNVVRLEEVLEAMMDLEQKTRECYSVDIYKKTDELAYLMTINGCFVVELLRHYNKFMTDQEKPLEARGGSSDSPIVAARWVLPSLQRDLIKLSNQLPFFVLEKVFLLTSSGNDEPSLQNLFLSFFTSMLSLNESIYRPDPNPTRNYAHPLDLCRSLFIFPIQQRRHIKVHPKKNPKLMYSVQELQETGVRFMKKEDSHLLDITFDMGVLKISPLSIDENTTTFLLNFAAYEECDRSQKPYFINYLLFLDCLINTIEDVEILRKNGIIWYPTGTEQRVIDLFHNFCKETLYSFDQNYFLLDMNAVNNHCKAYYDSHWRIWWSDLKKKHFSSPWTFLSLVAAILLLIFTLLQALYMIIPYYHPIQS